MFCRNFAETKNNCSASKSDRAKTQLSFVDSHESSVGVSVWWAWPQLFARYIDRKCCKFLAQLWLIPPGLERGLPVLSINITI